MSTPSLSQNASHIYLQHVDTAIALMPLLLGSNPNFEIVPSKEVALTPHRLVTAVFGHIQSCSRLAGEAVGYDYETTCSSDCIARNGRIT